MSHAPERIALPPPVRFREKTDEEVQRMVVWENPKLFPEEFAARGLEERAKLHKAIALSRGLRGDILRVLWALFYYEEASARIFLLKEISVPESVQTVMAALQAVGPEEIFTKKGQDRSTELREALHPFVQDALRKWGIETQHSMPALLINDFALTFETLWHRSMASCAEYEMNSSNMSTECVQVSKELNSILQRNPTRSFDGAIPMCNQPAETKGFSLTALQHLASIEERYSGFFHSDRLFTSMYEDFVTRALPVARCLISVSLEQGVN